MLTHLEPSHIFRSFRIAVLNHRALMTDFLQHGAAVVGSDSRRVLGEEGTVSGRS